MLLSCSDIFIILTRLFLETVSYYNAKTMYALKGYNKLSPLLVLYLTHSLGTILFLRDLIVHRSSYIKKVEKDTRLSFKFMVLSTAFLSLFYNLCHIPKFYAMNFLSDVSIVSIYGCSVIFTYIFAVVLINAKLDSVGMFSVSLGVLGMLLLVWNDNSLNKHIYLVSCVCISSVLSGMYGVFFKMVMCHDVNNKNKECLNCLEKDRLVYNVSDGKADRTKQECDECIKRYAETRKQAGNTKIAEQHKNTDAYVEYKDDYNYSFAENRAKFENNSYEGEVNSNNSKQQCYSHRSSCSKSNGQDSLLNGHPNDQKDCTCFDKYHNKNSSQKANNANANPSLESSEVELYNKNLNRKIEFKNVEDKEKHFMKYKITNETYRKLMFMRHYMSLTGLITFVLYWPGLYIVHCRGCEDISLPTKIRPIIHIVIANIFSVLHNIIYFVIVAVKTPLFAQISGIIMQPTFLFISIVENRGISCVTELSGCILSFAAFLLLCNRH